VALTGWAAFKDVGSDAVAHVDLAVKEAEVNPVVGKLRAERMEVTAIHNHLLGESPRVMYVHFWGRGPAARLASSLRAALAVTETPQRPRQPLRRPTRRCRGPSRSRTRWGRRAP